MTVEIGDIRLFSHIVEAGSLSEAARRLRWSLTTVSRRLTRLEKRLDVRLIERSSQKFVLTEEGRVYNGRIVSILLAIDEAEAEAKHKAVAAEGRLRISAPHEIGRRRIAPLIAEFAAAHPKIEIQYFLTDRRPGVRAEDFDVVIQTKRPTDGDVIHRRLLSSRRVVCATPQYIARHGAPTSPSDLRNHNCIRIMRGHDVYSHWRFCENDLESDVEVSGSLVASSTDVIHGWLRGGYGLAMKALWDVERELADGRLIEVLRPFACDDVHLYATFATRSHLPPRIRLLLDFIAARLNTSVSRNLEDCAHPRGFLRV